MPARTPKPGPLVALRLALRFAWRELRGGLRGFGVFVACIALGVLAIAGVGSVAASLDDGIAGAGRVILGGDLAFSLIQRQADAGERAFLDAHGRVSVAANLRAMARTITKDAAEARATTIAPNLPEWANLSGGVSVHIIAIAAVTLEIISDWLDRAGALAGRSPYCVRPIS